MMLKCEWDRRGGAGAAVLRAPGALGRGACALGPPLRHEHALVSFASSLAVTWGILLRNKGRSPRSNGLKVGS